MKKVLSLVAVVGMFTFVACGPSAAEKEAKAAAEAQHVADSIAQVQAAAAEQAKADSIANAEKMAKEKATADSLAKAEEEAKKPKGKKKK